MTTVECSRLVLNQITEGTMSFVRQGLAFAAALSTIGDASMAMAGKHGTPGANLDAPGQAGSNPGQVWKSEKNDASIVSPLSPGQQYNEDRNNAVFPLDPPGQTFGTPGQPIR